MNDLKSINRNLAQKKDHIAQRLHVSSLLLPEFVFNGKSQHEYKELTLTCQNDKAQAQRLLLTSLDALMIHKQELQVILKF